MPLFQQPFLVHLVRQAAQRASKRVRVSRSDTDEEKSDTEGSEFKLSGDSSSDETEQESDGSNPSSDFNPFYSDSDSDAGKAHSHLIQWRINQSPAEATKNLSPPIYSFLSSANAELSDHLV